MIHDEETTEIEIPPKLSIVKTTSHSEPPSIASSPKTEKLSTGPVVMAAGVPSASLSSVATAHNEMQGQKRFSILKSRKQSSLEWIKSFDVSEPWLLRLIAVLTILLLSILVL